MAYPNLKATVTARCMRNPKTLWKSKPTTPVDQQDQIFPNQIRHPSSPTRRYLLPSKPLDRIPDYKTKRR
ncbi:hypothetical protein PHET_09590 [Paragonimus heterotremus]|uniref:Uncharacterized protein n=1 Tax=Paragonimus heterotremus TaxID=100268 RepID=A0A8J4SGY4_9TREM|nr:hypothetical protein PHET_09590 [Paragonimus heterotremus]